MFTTLISPQELAQHLQDPHWVIVDCHFNLADTEAGRQAYLQSHIAGAVYAHMAEDLSGPPVTDNGRHPLPTAEALCQTFGKLGIDANKQVVAYDAHNGAYAARLWWLLRYMGHTAVAVLDGGWAAWQNEGYAVQSGQQTNPTTVFTGQPQTTWLVRLEEVQSGSLPLLVDSRDPARYRGETEPIDAQAGHIPSALNYYFTNNWSSSGRYLPSEQLRQQFQTLFKETNPETAVFYCGSGVTACTNLLALAHSGLGNGRLYAGSWSEYSRTDSPIATNLPE